jgi:hypothetical protein
MWNTSVVVRMTSPMVSSVTLTKWLTVLVGVTLNVKGANDAPKLCNLLFGRVWIRGLFRICGDGNQLRNRKGNESDLETHSSHLPAN